MNYDNLSPQDLDSLTDREMEVLALQLWQRQTTELTVATNTSRFENYQLNPVGFARDVLGRDPWSKQEEILESVRDNTYTAVRSCHGAGKTFTASLAALWFLQSFPGSCVITTAPSGRQVKDLLWRQIRANYENARTELLGRIMTTQLDISPDWYATGFATDEPINFQGPHSPKGVLFIGDEASGLAEWVFDTARGFMTQNNARMLLIGNPNYASGSFFEAFQSNRWKAIHISAFDVPPHILRPDWKEEMRDDFDEDNPIYQIRVLGNFPFMAENSLFDTKWVEGAFDRELKETSPCEVGVDIARFGTDQSTAFVRRGPKVVEMLTWHGKDLMQSAGKVAELCRRHWPDRIKVDEIGIGSGVLDRLKEQGWPAVGVNSNAAPKRRADFFNKRAELYAQLADRFRDGTISIPEDRKLLGQLVGLTYEHTSKGQRKIVGKEELRKQGKRSPDRADALMLCFAEDVLSYRAKATTAVRATEAPPSGPRGLASAVARRTSLGRFKPLQTSRFPRRRVGG